MKLSDLFEAFREDAMLRTILKQFSQMMEDARWMFEAIGRIIVEGADPDTQRQAIYDRDQRINQAERGIRKKIIEHLTLNPSRDLGTALVLFSASKDAERLGDYCKNLREVAVLLHGRPYPSQYRNRIADLHRTIAGLFTRTAQAISNADTAEGKAIMDACWTAGRTCDNIVAEVMTGPDDQDAKGAAATTLTARYLKRVAGHISNIASGVVHPVHRIDFERPDDLTDDLH